MSRLAFLSITVGLLSLVSGCCSPCGGCGARPMASYNYSPAYPTAYAPQYSTAYAVPSAGCSSCAAGVAPF